MMCQKESVFSGTIERDCAAYLIVASMTRDNVSTFTSLIIMLLLSATARSEPESRVPPPKSFVDITAQAGISHIHHKPVLDAKVKNIMPWLSSVGAAAAAADYDGDGWIDLYVTQSDVGLPNYLYRNNGDFTFTDVAEKAGVARINEASGVSMDAVFADYDNDGDQDLYVVKWGCNRLFRNNGDGSFTDVTKQSGTGDCGNANAAIFLDVDNDGDLDIYVGNYFDYVDLWHLKSTRFMHDSFERARNGGRNVLYRNNGDGTFINVAAEFGVDDTGWTLDVGAADIDNDGDMDLLSANDFGPDKLFRNNGADGFADVSENTIGTDTRKGMNAEFGDYNNDGWIDIYVTNIMTEEYLKEGNCLHQNLGDGSFVDVAVETGCADGGWGWCAKFFDFDNDADLDLYSVNGFVSAGDETYWFDLATWATDIAGDPAEATRWPEMGEKSLSGHEANRFFRNDGADGFGETAAELGVDDRRDGRGVVVADFDNDGDVDLFVANQGAAPVLYRNDVGNKNNWLQLELKGRSSSRDAIGARLEVFTGDLMQVREVDPGNGFGSQSSRRVQFGLGKAAVVDSVRVRWPSGTRQILSGISANQLLRVEEP
ncbi:MAG TPA: CRTAC1 family protein [Candidatus Deferrimicrobium sp.]|nr:CRTAC1 family protein [Candidatus Deferrimicrobium sp.]